MDIHIQGAWPFFGGCQDQTPHGSLIVFCPPFYFFFVIFNLTGGGGVLLSTHIREKGGDPSRVFVLVCVSRRVYNTQADIFRRTRWWWKSSCNDPTEGGRSLKTFIFCFSYFSLSFSLYVCLLDMSVMSVGTIEKKKKKEQLLVHGLLSDV
jgi:hypothetical protein